MIVSHLFILHKKGCFMFEVWNVAKGRKVQEDQILYVCKALYMFWFSLNPNVSFATLRVYFLC